VTLNCLVRPAGFLSLALLFGARVAQAQSSGLQFDVVQGSDHAFKPNAVIVYDDEEAILFDSLLILSDGEKVAQRISELDRKLTAIYLTHGHPDHVYGVVSVLEHYPGVSIFARPEVKEEIERNFLATRRRLQEMYRGDIPAELPPIEVLEGQIEFSGTNIEWIDTWRAETFAATVFYLASLQTVVPGDLIFNGMHLYLADMNDPVNWVNAINQVREAFPDAETVIPGHGPVAGTDLYDLNIGYLDAYMAVATGPFTSLEVIGEHLFAKYPDWDWPIIVHMTVGPAVTHPELMKLYAE